MTVSLKPTTRASLTEALGTRAVVIEQYVVPSTLVVAGVNDLAEHQALVTVRAELEDRRSAGVRIVPFMEYVELLTEHRREELRRFREERSGPVGAFWRAVYRTFPNFGRTP